MQASALRTLRRHECFMLGIPLRTRHREGGPNQYEYAPHFGLATAQIDENLVVMEIIEDVARQHGLLALAPPCHLFTCRLIPFTSCLVTWRQEQHKLVTCNFVTL